MCGTGILHMLEKIVKYSKSVDILVCKNKKINILIILLITITKPKI